MNRPILCFALLLNYLSVAAQSIYIKDVSPTATTFPIARTVNQSASGRVHCVSGSSDGTRLYAGTYAGVWRSDDGGINWYQLTFKQPSSSNNDVPGALMAEIIMDIIVSPVNKDLVLVMAKTNTRNSKNGIYRTSDGGRSWSFVQPVSHNGGQVVFSPDDPNLLFSAAGPMYT
jgi:photosystem II stability/assembly factor-like uncharacterized protein